MFCYRYYKDYLHRLMTCSFPRHGVPGGADGGAGEGADGARRRARGDHHLLVKCWAECFSNC